MRLLRAVCRKEKGDKGESLAINPLYSAIGWDKPYATQTNTVFHRLASHLRIWFGNGGDHRSGPGR